MTIRIEALRFEAVIGILDFERHAPQSVRVDAEIGYDYETDRYIDYAAVAECIKTTVKEGRFGLIETALETLQNRLKTEFPAIKTLTLSLSKPDILSDCTVTLSEHYNF